MALGPAGCGFRPLYGKMETQDAAVSGDLGQVRILPIKDRMGQQLRNALVARLTPRGEAADYAYLLEVLPSENVNNLGFRRDSFATVANLNLSARIQLSRGGLFIMADTATTTVYFDHLGPRYASVAMEREAEERALNQLADEIRNRVAVAIRRYRANPDAEIYRRRAIFSGENEGLR